MVSPTITFILELYLTLGYSLIILSASEGFIKYFFQPFLNVFRLLSLWLNLEAVIWQLSIQELAFHKDSPIIMEGHPCPHYSLTLRVLSLPLDRVLIELSCSRHRTTNILFKNILLP